MSTSNSLAKHPDFLKLWAGQSISLLGTQVSRVALPIIAVMTLNATPSQMGLLGALQFAPYLVLGLFAGVWVDRMHRRPVLIWTDIGRAVATGLAAFLAMAGLLTMNALFALGLAMGIFSVLFDVAYPSYLPSLVAREQLLEGNAKLQGSMSLAGIGGPGLGGALVQFVGAGAAIAVDAASYVLSAISLALIRAKEHAPALSPGMSMAAQMREGVQLVLGHRFLRSLAWLGGAMSFLGAAMMAIYTLHLVRAIGMSASLLGTVLALASVGALAGVIVSRRVTEQFGLGPIVVYGSALAAVGGTLISFAPHTMWVAVVVQVSGMLCFGFAGGVINVNSVSVRQAITPHRLQGRVNATYRVLTWGMLPIGSLVGGALGDAIGVQRTLFVIAAGWIAIALWVPFSPVARVRGTPDPIPDPAAAAIAA